MRYSALWRTVRFGTAGCGVLFACSLRKSLPLSEAEGWDPPVHETSAERQDNPDSQSGLSHKLTNSQTHKLINLLLDTACQCQS
jgi:hypothetical protein